MSRDARYLHLLCATLLIGCATSSASSGQDGATTADTTGPKAALDSANAATDAGSANDQDGTVATADVGAAATSDVIAPTDTTQADSAGAKVEAVDSVKAGYFQLADNLDEPEGYCLDIPGFGNNIKLDSPLMMHTCKHKYPNNSGDDEMFEHGQPSPGHIHAFVYQRCAQVKAIGADQQVLLKPCSNDPLQQFIITTSGQIRLKTSAGQPLCMAAADGSGEVAGGNSNLRRNLRMQPCDTVDKSLSTWVFPGKTKPK